MQRLPFRSDHCRSKKARHLLLGSLLVLCFFPPFRVFGCSFRAPDRRGSFLLEDSLVVSRSDPNKLVAVMGYYNESEHWNALAEKRVFIDTNTGEMAWVDEDYDSVGSHATAVIEPDHNRAGYDFQIQVDYDTGTATMTGGPSTAHKQVVYTFPYMGPLPPVYEDSDSDPEWEWDDDWFDWYEHFGPTYFYASSTHRVYFVYPLNRTTTLVEIMDVSDPSKNVSRSTFHYSTADDDYGKQYHGGRHGGVWDELQVVKLPRGGGDCITSLYLYFNETGVYYLVHNTVFSYGFHLNACQGSYAYTIRTSTTDYGSYYDHYEVPNGYILQKTHIPTGKKTDLVLQNITTTKTGAELFLEDPKEEL